MNFTFLNIPVRIEPTFWFLLLFFTGFYQDPSMDSVMIGVIMTVSLLVHEYGHALTAVYFGTRPSITLEGMGGYAEYGNYGISKKQELLITINGPLFESLLIVFPFLFLRFDVFAAHPNIEYILYVTMRINIWWCLLNLIPIDPLDGGRIARYFLDKIFDDQGYKISLFLGVACAAVIAPYLYLEGSTYFPLLLLILGLQNFQKLRQEMSKNEVSHFSLYMRGIEAERLNDFEEAKKNFKKLLNSSDNQLKHSAIESLAKIYHSENKGQKSYELLLKADHQLLGKGKSLLCQLAFERKNYQLVSQYSRDNYSVEPSFDTAILNSQAFAFLNQPDLAAGWLVTASQFGAQYQDKIKDLLKLSTYDTVRDHAAFKNALTLV
jgi:Zn-dependent protease